MAVNYTIEHFPVPVPPNSNTSNVTAESYDQFGNPSNIGLTITAKIHPKPGYTVGASDFTIEGNQGIGNPFPPETDPEVFGQYMWPGGGNYWSGPGSINISDNAPAHTPENFLSIIWIPELGNSFLEWGELDLQYVLDLDGDAKPIPPQENPGDPSSFFLEVKLATPNPNCKIWPLFDNNVNTPYNIQPFYNSQSDDPNTAAITVIDGTINDDTTMVKLRFNLDAIEDTGVGLGSLGYIKFIIIPDSGYVVSRHSFNPWTEEGPEGYYGGIASDYGFSSWMAMNNTTDYNYLTPNILLYDMDGITSLQYYLDTFAATGNLVASPCAESYLDEEDYVNYTAFTGGGGYLDNDVDLWEDTVDDGDVLASPYLDPYCYCVTDPADPAYYIGCGDEPYISVEGEGIQPMSQTSLPQTGTTVANSTSYYPSTVHKSVPFQMLDQVTGDPIDIPGIEENELPAYAAGYTSTTRWFGFQGNEYGIMSSTGGCSTTSSEYLGNNADPNWWNQFYLTCTGPARKGVTFLDSIMQSELPIACSEDQINQYPDLFQWEDWCGNKVRIAMGSYLKVYYPESNVNADNYPHTMRINIYGKATQCECNSDGETTVDMSVDFEVD